MTITPDLQPRLESRCMATLEGLSAEQWSTMTACDPWTVRDLVAHTTALGNQTAPNFFVGLIKYGFSFDKFVANDLRRFNEGSDADVLARFERTLDSENVPPGPKYVPLGEYVVHGEDIRRAVGIRRTIGEAQLLPLADAYVTTGAPIGGKKRVAGLKLRATDADWQHGDGSEVAGPIFELIRATTGRSGALDACERDGVATMLSR